MDEKQVKSSSSSWWEWIGWNRSHIKKETVKPIEPSTSQEEVKVEEKVAQPSTIEITTPETGWDRIKRIYQDDINVERDLIQRVVRMSFLGGFLVGGATGYAQARHAYELNNQGRKYLSPSDAVKRKIDYAIVRFAKGGFGIGFKCALISGAIVSLTTVLSAYRDRFSSWYFPAISGAMACTLHSVGGIFAFPLGLLGTAKAVGLGITSGLTLSAVVHLYALSIDKPVNEAYGQFKKEYYKELKSSAEWDSRVTALMEAENIWWRQEAVKKLKKMDHDKLAVHDD